MNVKRIKKSALNPSAGFITFSAFALCCAAGLNGQNPTNQFETPKMQSAETLGGQQFGGDQQGQQLEDISGEVIPGSAGLIEPDFGQYGPVGGQAGKTPADQTPRLQQRPGAQVLSREEALPNEYKGELIYPSWMGRDSNEGQSSSRRPPIQESAPRSVKESARDSGLRIDGLKAIENANRDFDSSSHEIIRERYPDGSIKIVRTVTQDEDGNYYNDGRWLLYDQQQRPIASGTFVRGAMEGVWERVHEPGSGELFSQSPFNLFSGPYLSRANFVRNEIDGVWAISDKSGDLIFSITYNNGVREGLASWFYPSGKKMREATFKDGVPHGIVLQWDQQGKIQRREQFVDGRKVIRKKSTYANQTLASEKVFRDQRLLQKGADNWWAAKPATFVRDGEEVQHGPVAEWYPNQQPRMTGRYIDGQRDGLFTWWHTTHNKKAEGNFSKGKRTGLWRYWHESGMKRSEGRFENDKPVGLWREWNADGQIVDEKDIDAAAAEVENSVIDNRTPENVGAEDVGAEEVVGEEVNSGPDAESDSVLDKGTSTGFEVDLKVTDPESIDGEPVSDGDPFGEDEKQDEPGAIGSLKDT